MKKGFTLIEIILSITIIAIIGIGSTISVFQIQKKINNDKLDNMSAEIYNAVHILIETDEITKKQLYENKNIVRIPLIKLENEGLVDFGDIDINGEYVTTMLGSTDESNACSGSLYDVSTWTKSSDDIIYICTNDQSSGSNDQSSGSNDVKSNLLSQGDYYIAKGEKPNNWVEFSVTPDTNKPAYFPNDTEKDLWRIISIDYDGNIKLIYNKNIVTNNQVIYDSSSKNKTNSSLTYYVFPTDYSKCFGAYTTTSDYYKRYNNIKDWTYYELISDDCKKADLLNQIDNKNWITQTDYYFEYYKNSNGFNINVGNYNPDSVSKLKLGTISVIEYLDTFLFNKTWISPDSTFLFGKAGNYGVHLHNGNILTQLDITNSSSLSKTEVYGGAEYRPALVLQNGVQIKENETCQENVEQGSQDCPYKLECSNCSV